MPLEGPVTWPTGWPRWPSHCHRVLHMRIAPKPGSITPPSVTPHSVNSSASTAMPAQSPNADPIHASHHNPSGRSPKPTPNASAIQPLMSNPFVERSAGDGGSVECRPPHHLHCMPSCSPEPHLHTQPVPTPAPHTCLHRYMLSQHPQGPSPPLHYHHQLQRAHTTAPAAMHAAVSCYKPASCKKSGPGSAKP